MIDNYLKFQVRYDGFSFYDLRMSDNEADKDPRLLQSESIDYIFAGVSL